MTSVIFNTGRVSAVRLPMSSTRKYFRASPYTPSNEICNANSKFIRFGKDIWAWEKQRFATDTPADTDLYGGSGILHATRPRCPAGGAYTTEGMLNLPTCTIPGHLLEEPR